MLRTKILRTRDNPLQLEIISVVQLCRKLQEKLPQLIFLGSILLSRWQLLQDNLCLAAKL